MSPSPAKLGSYGKSTFFTASNVAMAVLELEAMNTVAQSLAGQFAWDIAPNVQYREYEGGDLNADGTLKVIGVDGYTGALKTVEGTAVVGKQAGSSLNLCFAIPANAPNRRHINLFNGQQVQKDRKFLQVVIRKFQTIKRRIIR